MQGWNFTHRDFIQCCRRYGSSESRVRLSSHTCTWFLFRCIDKTEPPFISWNCVVPILLAIQTRLGEYRCSVPVQKHWVCNNITNLCQSRIQRLRPPWFHNQTPSDHQNLELFCVLIKQSKMQLSSSEKMLIRLLAGMLTLRLESELCNSPVHPFLSATKDLRDSSKGYKWNLWRCWATASALLVSHKPVVTYSVADRAQLRPSSARVCPSQVTPFCILQFFNVSCYPESRIICRGASFVQSCKYCCASL